MTASLCARVSESVCVGVSMHVSSCPVVIVLKIGSSQTVTLWHWWVDESVSHSLCNEQRRAPEQYRINSRIVSFIIIAHIILQYVSITTADVVYNRFSVFWSALASYIKCCNKCHRFFSNFILGRLDTPHLTHTEHLLRFTENIWEQIDCN